MTTVPKTYFSGDFKLATLYVPAGTVATYKKTEGWKMFPNIVEMDAETLGVTDVQGYYRTPVTPIYDLGGRKYTSKQKGLNIMNGRKYIQK